MNTPESPAFDQTADAMAEIQAMLGMMHASGAMDEEGPFVQSLMEKIDRGTLSPAEARNQLRAKVASQQNYH
jgi:hypothetical protein